MERAVCLVDYDNVRNVRERTMADVDLNLDILVERLVAISKTMATTINELLLRLYGGWVDEYGRLTKNAEWILALLSQQRGRRSGVRIKPTLITSLAASPADRLVGTFRSLVTPPRQKMVDGILTLDAVYFAEQGDWLVFIVSDDDDLVPAALAASGRLVISERSICLVRKRLPGEGLNDSLLVRCEVALRGLN